MSQSEEELVDLGPDLDDADEPLRAADGRIPGRRGRATRQRLLECTVEMLAATSYRDLKVVDIAREAGTSPATFYQYFPDVESALLVVAEDLAAKGQRLVELVEGKDWTRGQAGYDTALEVAKGFIEFWEAHRPILRVVDLLTDEGDLRFQNFRTRLLNGFTVALRDVIREAKKAGRHPKSLDAMATAGALVSMLAHVSAHRYGFEFWGVRTAELERSMAYIIYGTVTTHQPPGG